MEKYSSCIQNRGEGGRQHVLKIYAQLQLTDWIEKLFKDV